MPDNKKSTKPAEPEKDLELSPDDLEQVAGGVPTSKVTSKSKTADKAYNAMDGYIRS